MPKALGWLSVRWTIKGRIAMAFISMSVITVTLGVFAVTGANRAGHLVESTYDETVISTSYARAAASDFANMRAGFAHELTSPSGRRDTAKLMSSAIEQSFQADLATAIEKSSSTGVVETGNDLRKAEADWLAASKRMASKPGVQDWDDLEGKARIVEEKIEALVTLVSDRGYARRQEAQATVTRDIGLVSSGVAAALAISFIVALMLYLRISAPLGAAARFANEIASGTLDGDAPKPSADEIGDLIRAMVSMRTDIGGMMGEQVILREQSQARVAEALDGSREGVVVVDAKGVIQIANERALDFLGLARPDVVAGTTVADVLKKLGRAQADRSALLQMRSAGPETEETQLPDGRWIQNSRNRTTEGGMVALYTDITAIRDQTDRLSEANTTLDAALGNMSQGLCLFDADDRLKLANTRFRSMFDLADDEFPPGTPYEEMVRRALATEDESASELDRVMRHERALIRRRRSFSRSITIGDRVFAAKHEPMVEGGWIATYEDITDRRRAESQIAFLANHDALTHLANRPMFARRVDEAITRARRGTGFAVHCLDLDHFKQVNDTLGHAVGDMLLRAVTDRLLACVRDTDTIARLGGDEFAILQADVTGPADALVVARRVIAAVSAPYNLDGHDVIIGVSVGIALSPGDGLTHGQLLKSADSALYKSKEDGRGTWRFFERAMDEKLQARHALEADLRHAIAHKEFEVHYQPLLDVRSTKIGGFEALVRWRHPTRGLVAPDSFIPLAEETGMIKDIGKWVLGEACAEARTWPAGMRVAVNVSAIQLRDESFVQVVTDALAASGLPANQLELEITESVFMANNAKVLPLLTALRSIGVRFAMDDFGTGYSSLSTLRAFPFDKIKIDRSFVRDLGVADAAEQIVSTILALGRSLRMRVTAEGVETREQLAFLQEEGCDEIQGYLVGKPMPAVQVKGMLSEYNDRSQVVRAA